MQQQKQQKQQKKQQKQQKQQKKKKKKSCGDKKGFIRNEETPPMKPFRQYEKALPAAVLF